MSEVKLRDCRLCDDEISITVDYTVHDSIRSAGEAQGYRFVYQVGPGSGWTCKHCVGATPEQIQANRVAAALRVKR